jgi:5'-phosphate synthase pdxT subunit
MKVGVLGLQGDVREHSRALASADATPVVVKTRDALASVDALIIPGGESTTIGKLLDRFELLEPLMERADAGMPMYGTCAGAILMSREIAGAQDAPFRIPVLDVVTRRNAYGRQVDSFETDLVVDGLEGPFRAVFIRAPVFERVGDSVEVLASVDDDPVLVRQGAFLASTFHPEMTGDNRVHELFVSMIKESP